MDLSSLGTLAGTLAAQNAPLLGNLFTTVATMAGAAIVPGIGGPIAGMMARGVSDLVLKKLAAGLGTAVDPDAINTAIVANPAAAAPVIQQIQDDHSEIIKDALDAANREFEIQTADTQDARRAMVALSGQGSVLSDGPVVVSTVVTGGFIGILTLLMFVRLNLDANGVVVSVVTVLVGALAAAFGQVVNFWLGSSKGSKDKTNALIGMAQAPTVQAQPGSSVHTGSVKGGR